MVYELYRNVKGINISLGQVPESYIPKNGEIKTVVGQYTEEERITPLDLSGYTEEQITEVAQILKEEDYKKLLVFYNQLGYNYCCVSSVLRIVPHLKKALYGV